MVHSKEHERKDIRTFAIFYVLLNEARTEPLSIYQIKTRVKALVKDEPTNTLIRRTIKAMGDVGFQIGRTYDVDPQSPTAAKRIPIDFFQLTWPAIP